MYCGSYDHTSSINRCYKIVIGATSCALTVNVKDLMYLDTFFAFTW